MKQAGQQNDGALGAKMRKQFRQHPANAVIGTNEIHLARIELATFSVLS